jgi:iron(III) transport system substrate-binding protein
MKRFAFLAALVPLLLATTACRKHSPAEVVVYTSVDQPQAEPVLKAFEARTGIHVLPVYDVEAVKTVGLANRIIEEKGRPKADVFWNGEILQTLRLDKEGLLEAYQPPTAAGLPASYLPADQHWTAIGGRARILLVDTRQVTPATCPRSIADLAKSPIPANRRGMAMPLFGTALTHAATLYTLWGPEKAHAWFADLKQQGVRMLEGNASVREAVARGELAFGILDTDDAEEALGRGDSVAVSELDGDGALVIPGSIALVKGSPHPESGRVLMDFLASPEAEAMLGKGGFFQVTPRNPGTCRSLPSGHAKSMDVDWAKVLEVLPRTSEELQGIFLK